MIQARRNNNLTPRTTVDYMLAAQNPRGTQSDGERKLSAADDKKRCRWLSQQVPGCYGQRRHFLNSVCHS